MDRPARKTYLDALRILACLWVIYNHVVAAGLMAPDAQNSFLALYGYFFCKSAVPLFFMISGALLLPRVDSYQKTFSRILRIALALALVVSVNYALYCVRNGAPFSVKTLLLCLYRDTLGVTYSYWYLYAYLGMLVMLPILQRLACRSTRADRCWYLAFSVGLCGLATAALVLFPQAVPNEALKIPLFSVYIGMLLLGYVLDRYTPLRRGYAAAACVGALVANAVQTLLLYRAEAAGVETAWSLDNCAQTCIVLTAACLFYLCRWIFAVRPPSARVGQCVSYLGQLTFCVYLASEILIEALSPFRAWLAAYMPAYGAERVYVLAVFAAGLLVAAVLTRIPLLRKLL